MELKAYKFAQWGNRRLTDLLNDVIEDLPIH